MRVLIDANIWIDIAARSTTQHESVAVYRLLEKKHHTICFPLCAYTTVYYIIGQLIGKPTALDFLSQLLRRGVYFFAFREDEVSLAQSLPLVDHEDACIASTALLQKVDYILTRNTKDFKNSPISAISPPALKKLL